MKDIDSLKKIAVLVDADNAQLVKLKLILDEISVQGHIITKRAYGDWSKDTLKNWRDELNKLAVQPIQQFSYTSGKNATDTAMIIDAMDLLYSNKYDAFVLISSDSDFTKLASRLRESEMFVFGVGEHKTPESFRNACDTFIFTENLDLTSNQGESKILISAPDSAAPESDKSLDISDIVDLLDIAGEKYANEDGWVNVSSAGVFIQRTRPDFDTRTFGYRKLPDLIKHLPQFEVKKYDGKGTVKIVAYRRKQKQTQAGNSSAR